MARLQILELPAGPDDDRPPFMLVVDQITDDESEQVIASHDVFNGVAEAAGARAVVAFHGMTVEIPANGTTAYLDAISSEEQDSVDYGELLGIVRRALGVTSEDGPADIAGWLHTACRELEKSEAARAHLRTERDALKKRLQQVQEAPIDPEAIAPGREHPNVWAHGYRAGVLATKAAARPRNEETTKP
jgi:hypothetical protein